jgi:hypothetical protein
MINFSQKQSARCLTAARAFSTILHQTDASFIGANQFRCDDLISKLDIPKEFRSLAFQKAFAATHENHLKKPLQFLESDKEISKKIVKLVEDYFIPKAAITSRMMYADEYKKIFLPATSVTSLELGMLSSTKYDPQGFKRLETNYNEFEILENTLPSEAIESFIEGPTICDCGSAIEAIYFKVLRNEINEVNFNALFSKPDLRLRITHNGPLHSQSLINLFTRQCLQFQQGARAYFYGHSGYTVKHGNGIGLGLHSVMLDKEKSLFWGLGLQGPKTSEEIKAYLLAQYNEDPQENLLLSMKEKLELEDKESLQDFSLPKLGGVEYVDVLSSEMIEFVNRTPLNEIRDPIFRKKLIIKNLSVQIKALIDHLNMSNSKDL